VVPGQRHGNHHQHLEVARRQAGYHGIRDESSTELPAVGGKIGRDEWNGGRRRGLTLPTPI